MRLCTPLLLLFFASSALAGCASTGAVPKPFPGPGSTARPAPSRPPGGGPADVYAISGTALSLRGAPYRNGGSDPSGFDCSGFTWYVFAQHGISLPRTVSDQFHAGRPIDSTAVQPGDLVFFSTTAPGPSHVGIVIGGDEFVHAPTSSGLVRVDHLGASYWTSRFIGARRVI